MRLALVFKSSDAILYAAKYREKNVLPDALRCRNFLQGFSSI